MHRHRRQQAERDALLHGLTFIGTAWLLNSLGRDAQPGGLYYETGRKVLEKQLITALVYLAKVAVP